MPEYLAPGVYVEETSFRAKSIEGVGTSTTAFLGPTRKGPIAPPSTDRPETLELLTSFADFERIYGGLEALDFAKNQPNYLAHAVMAFFQEGGSRLYVARVAAGASEASLKLGGDLPENRVNIKARFPGAAGNGTVAVREIVTPAFLPALKDAAVGSVLRQAAAPARAAADTAGPYTLTDGARLRLVLKDGSKDITLTGKPTEAVGDTPLTEPVNLGAANRSLTVTVNNVDKVVALNPTYATIDALVADLNTKLGASGVTRQDATHRLIIGAKPSGYNARLKVSANPDLHFTAKDVQGTRDPVNNNVGDLSNISVADLNKLFAENGAPVVASLEANKLVLTTTTPGTAQTLNIVDATAAPVVSAHTGLHLVVGANRGADAVLFRKQNLAANNWKSGAAADLTLPGDDHTQAGNLISLSIVTEDGDGISEVYDEVELASGDARYLGKVLPQTPSTRSEQLRQTYWFELGTIGSLELHAALFPSGAINGNENDGFAAVHVVSGGTDGTEPTASPGTTPGSYAAAFAQLAALEDISIVAAPGHSAFSETNYRDIRNALIIHASAQRAYRIAVLDTPDEMLPSEARQERAQIDSTYAALYYPWVTVANPLARPGRSDIPREINLPPSGFICGIYARNDVEKSVSKAPANEVVRSALRFESDINFAQNQLLNPLGVNCLRYFPGRGYRVWGARTASSDPEWKYVNVRRYFIYLEASIDRGTQWAVFENNGQRLWANIRETVEGFLYNEWVSGNLLGGTPQEAYFVRCDRGTMTQNDLDNGRLICLIGVAALKPAEFVIFRIGQKTADARS